MLTSPISRGERTMDRYIKAVLTVIAVCLVLLVAEHFISSSSAQSNDVQKVVLRSETV
jgi:hypothetical protein